MLAFIAVTAMAVPQGTPPLRPVTEPYADVTNTVRSVGNFNVETIRGLAHGTEAGGSDQWLYAINTHGSTLVRYALGSASPSNTPLRPDAVFRTLNNPTALALWDDSAGSEFAFVVGGGSHGVAKHDRNTGLIVDYLPLYSEPKDIVLDTQRGLGFISCAGAFDGPATTNAPAPSGGAVIEFDLDTMLLSGGDPGTPGYYYIDAMRPTFLSIEMGPVDGDNMVYVAPLLSANGTTYESVPLQLGVERVVAASGFPDEDLFRIDETGSVDAVLSGAGTLLTNHGVHPRTGDHWLLNVDSKNAAFRTEPEHRGRFADNRVTLATPTSSGKLNVAATLNLDSIAPGPGGNSVPWPGGPSPDKPVSYPHGLAFLQGGGAAIVGSTGDTLRILARAAAGVAPSTLRNVGLPEGSIPRGVLVSKDNARVWVYAWGTNQIIEFSESELVSGTGNSLTTTVYDLGPDPLPEAIQHGRELWYDGDNSEHPNGVRGSLTCNHCHPGGGMDMLGWELSTPPLDRKDLMVTQSLFSIEDTFPYHWRGERTLSEFNDAFLGILGGDPLSDPDLADFEAFVFSLQAPANPRQLDSREIDNSGSIWSTNGSTGVPGAGQEVFLTELDVLRPFEPARCVDCHSIETGTNGQITPDVLTIIPSDSNLDVTHLRQLHHKIRQPEVSVSLGGITKMRPRGGFALSQDGGDHTFTDFFAPAAFFTSPNLPAPRDQVVADMASFMLQFDQGIAPRAHAAARFAMDSNAQEVTRALEILDHARQGHCDLAAIGFWKIGGVPVVPFTLWFDPATDRFFTAEQTVGFSASDLDLNALRRQDIVDLMFIGLPLGGAFRFAVDPDNDGLSNTRELQATTPVNGTDLDPWNRDSDGDSFPDGYELDRFASTAPNGPNPWFPTSPPNVAAADVTLPDFASTPDLDFVSARLSKHFVEFTEPCSYTVQLLRRDSTTGNFIPFGPLQEHPAVRTKDTLVAQGMKPSVANLAQFQTSGTTLFDEEYRIEVVLTDLAQNTNTVTIPGNTSSLTTRPDVLGDIGLVGRLVIAAFPTPTVSAPGQATRQVSVTIDVDDTYDEDPTGSLLSHVQGQRLVLQLVMESTSAPGEFDPAPLTALAGTGATDVNQTFSAGALTYGVTGPIDGPFIFSPPTDANGVTTVSLDVQSSVAATGSNARLVVIGILRPVGALGNLDFFPLSGLSWALPMTPADFRAKPIVF